MNLKFRLHFLTFTWQTIVRLFLDYGQFHQPAVQFLQWGPFGYCNIEVLCIFNWQTSFFLFLLCFSGQWAFYGFFSHWVFNCVGCSYAHCSQHSGCPGGRNWSSRLAWATISKQASIHQQHQDSHPCYHFNMVFERRGILGLSAWQDGPLSLLYLMLLLLPQLLLFCLCISIDPFTHF